MAAEWKKILLDGDAAVPSDAAPANVGTVADKGVSAECSRADHVHDTAAGFIDSADKLAAEVVGTAALGPDAVTGDKIVDDAVGSEHIEPLSAKLEFNGQQAENMVLHTVADADARNALTPVKGKVVWQTDETHPFICTAEV